MKQKDQRQKIVEGLEEYPLGQVLRGLKLSRSTVLQWMRDDPEFAGRCLEAKRDRAEMLLETVQDELFKAVDEESAKVAQAKIKHLEWYLERMLPAVYGRRKLDPSGVASIAALLSAARTRAGITIEVPKQKELPR